MKLIDETRIALDGYSAFFGTRCRGRIVRDEAELLLTAARTLVLDFAGVKAATVAFADELAGNLVARYGPRIVLAGMNPDVAETLELALSRRTDLP